MDFIKRKMVYVLVVLSFFVAALWYQASNYMVIKTGEQFEEMAGLFKSENLMDIGVVDFDGDKYFDIFTTNHNQRQSLLNNKKNGKFIDVLAENGLSQSKDFPGVEISNQSPDFKSPGLYIFWQGKDLVLKWVPEKGGVAPSGRVLMDTITTITNNVGFDVKLSDEQKNKTEATKTVVAFTAMAEGQVHIVPKYIALPLSIVMDEEFPLKNIFVGQDKVLPKTHNFSFELVDRHGMAWADYNNDNKLDVFISRGGLKGRMGKFNEVFTDELFKGIDSGFVNVIDETKMVKKTCPAYQVQWLDFNNDNALDVYISCERRNENQLYMNKGNGEFVQVAEKMQVNVTKNTFHSPALWLDVNQDNKVDLLLNKGKEYILMVNTGAGFKANDNRLKLQDVHKMTVSDYDSDGDLDVYAVSTSGDSALLKNNGEYLEKIAAADLGLPASGLAANWVDYDNDGVIDLHVMPGGLFRQNNHQGFDETGLLNHIIPGTFFESIANWVDLDNDGDRDLVLAMYYKKPIWEQLYERVTGEFIPSWDRGYQPWQIKTFINKAEQTGNHWLQLKMIGRPGNVQAIGARVVLHKKGKKVASYVGHAEGSNLSQGHYRLYFGLGQSTDIESIDVHWQDGQYQSVDVNKIDQYMEIKQ